MKHQPFIHILSVCLLFLSHTASGYAQSETLSEKLIVQKAVNRAVENQWGRTVSCFPADMLRQIFVRPEAKLLRLAGEVARRAGGVSHAQE